MVIHICIFNKEQVTIILQFSLVQSLSCVQLFAPTAAYQASLSITNSQSLLKLMSIESVMPSYHLILNLSQHQGLFQ